MFLVTKLQVITKPRENNRCHTSWTVRAQWTIYYWTFNEHGMVPYLDPRIQIHTYTQPYTIKNHSPHVCHVPLTQFPSTLLSAILCYSIVQVKRELRKGHANDRTVKNKDELTNWRVKQYRFGLLIWWVQNPKFDTN